MERMYKIGKDIVFIILGAFLFALAINLFVIPNNLADGGVTGITIILYYLFQWGPGLVNFIINGVLILIGYRFLDKQTTIYTIIAVTFYSLFLHLTKLWHIESSEIFVNTIFGGVFAGVGIGMIFKVGGTIAGSSILAKITNKYLDWNTSFSLLFFDLIVVISSFLIIGAEKLMLTIIMLYVATKVMEFIIEGLNPKKAVTIISSRHSQIAEKVNDIMHRGVTVMYGRGYYSNEAKEILYLVISKQEMVTLKKIVKDVDSEAFIAINDVRDVFGKGFLTLSK
jgi:uncharacterized membrane-anchored protein YitT (DUF2179 family)